MTKKMGRPTKYTPDMPERVMECIGSGKSVAQFARDLNVTRSTIYEWASVHPEFSDALSRAQEHSEAAWLDKVEGMMTSRDVNVPLVKLYLANRFGWSDKQENVITGAAGGPVTAEVRIIHEIIDANDPT
jgi:transposase-like protein